MQLVFPLPTMLRLYRSVIGLTRALMQARMDVGLPPGLSDRLIALLENVRDTTGMHFPDRDMPIEDAIRLHAAIMKLAGIAHRARVGRLIAPRAVWQRPREAAPQPSAGNVAKDPLQRENALPAFGPLETHHAQPPLGRQHTVPGAEAASAGNVAKDPLQREDALPAFGPSAAHHAHPPLDRQHTVPRAEAASAENAAKDPLQREKWDGPFLTLPPRRKAEHSPPDASAGAAPPARGP